VAARLLLVGSVVVLSPFALLSAASRATPGHLPPDRRARPDLSHSGIMRAATPMPEVNNFASGNGISGVGGTVGVKLDPGAATGNSYTVHYSVSVTINGSSSTYGSATLVVAIETNDGTGWVERAAPSYNCGYLSGPPPWPTTTCSWSQEQPALTVTGLVLGDSIRLRAQSFSTSNGAGGSIVVSGSDVTYTTDMTVLVAASVDTPTARAVSNTGFTAGFTITNAGAAADSYTLTCSSQESACTGVSPSSVSNLTPGASAPVTVTYSTGGRRVPGGAWGWLELKATSSHGAEERGVIELLVVPYNVSVSPHGKNVGVLGSASRTQPFTVQNVSSAPVTYTFSVLCTGTAVSNCSQPASQSIPAASSATISVSYTSAAALGATGRVRLLASSTPGQDSGWVNVTVGSQMAPDTVDVSNTTPGTRVEPSICVTVAASRGAAYQCGDLRIVHALPTTRTLNKARTPTLLYNSQHAHPYPLVAANVYLDPAAATPDSVVATLRVNNVVHGRGRWDGADWTPGRASRIAVADTALARAAPLKDTVFSYTLGVVNWYGATATAESTTTSKFAVVNRSASPFGAGWWLAGLEHLDIGTKTWSAGDGALRQYTSAGTNVWAALTLDRPDTLKWDGTYYLRLVPHGDTVKFDAQGRHAATVNRLGQQTTFAYDGCGRLQSITLPPTGSGRVYQFAYASATDCTTKLQSVTAPPIGGTPRVTTVTVLNGRVTAIRDPDNTTVAFGYGTGADTNLIVSRTDRRGTLTSFTYDAGKRLARASTIMGKGSADITMKWRPVQSYGLPNRGSPSAIDTALAYTRLDGPRVDVADTTLFWESKFFAPYRIVNALGYETKLFHDDNRWRALVTHLVYPNGRALGAVYDDRGNLVSVTDSSVFQNGKYATTRYVWNRKWDFDSIVAPPEGDSTVMSYSDTNGNRLWQQDARGSVSRVEFAYYAADSVKGLLRSIRTPSQAWTDSRDSVEYNRVGNLTRTKTPMGFWTRRFTDAVGRDTLILTPVDSAQTLWQADTIRYDLMDREIARQHVGPATSSSPQTTLLTTNTFDGEGNPLSAVRLSSPDPTAIGTSTTRWHYDAAGRSVAEIAPDGSVDSTLYDVGGNAIRVITRRGDTLNMQYDPLSHLISRVVPAVSYRDTTATWHFPLYTNCSSTWLCISGDTATFSYDAVGNMLTANNRDARISRHYNLDGTLATDTLKIRTYAELNAGGDTTSHVYGLTFGYDLDRRRIYLKYPKNLAARLPNDPAFYDSVAYAYNAFTGQMASVRDVFGDVFSYHYDAESGLDTLYAPLGHFRRFGYDADGRLTDIRMDYTSTNGGALEWTSTYDASQRKRSTEDHGFGCGLTIGNAYSGLGSLAQSTRGPVNCTEDHTETWSLDALANIASYRDGAIPACDGCGTLDTVNVSNVYQPATGRLVSFTRSGINKSPFVPDQDPKPFWTSGANGQNGFDRSGNMYWTATWGVLHYWWFNTFTGGYSRTDYSQTTASASYFSAGQMLRVMDKRSSDTYNPSDPVYGYSAFEEYRYDALGRRILRRSRDGSSCTDPPKCYRQLIQRFVWDGSHILAEIQYPGGDGVSPSDLERDTVTIMNNSARYWGRVLYVNGSDLNRPLAIVRIGYGILTGGGSFDTGPNFDRWDPLVIAPAWDWHGDGTGHAFYGPTSPTKPDGSKVSITWPARQELAFQLSVSSNVDNNGFFGSYLLGQRDGTGQIYKVNRYYDPRTGRFTQEDPLGLAGGLNLYGFASGDPVNLSDPFGLCPPEDDNNADCVEPDAGESDAGESDAGSATSTQECNLSCREEWATIKGGNGDPGVFDPIAIAAGGVAGGVDALLASNAERSLAGSGARILANKVKGDLFRDEIAAQFEKGGYQVEKEVVKRTPFGARRIDIEVSKGGKVLGGIETKSGPFSRYTPWQRAKDAWLTLTGYIVQLVRDQ
jgi:RHS repeat-associated protein